MRHQTLGSVPSRWYLGIALDGECCTSRAEGLSCHEQVQAVPITESINGHIHLRDRPSTSLDDDGRPSAFLFRLENGR